ncbi:hypothetical protein [Fischerella sp. PCC 9605]|uniref:hypothetical protein n=1 Tax=Fischerella sp. PCC 9605 TaxID=1173024 RepID=UPI00047D4BF8|nr:hypothetical protein [Fischerella sp. PCC 9605]
MIASCWLLVFIWSQTGYCTQLRALLAAILAGTRARSPNYNPKSRAYCLHQLTSYPQALDAEGSAIARLKEALAPLVVPQPNCSHLTPCSKRSRAKDKNVVNALCESVVYLGKEASDCACDVTIIQNSKLFLKFCLTEF